MFDCLAVEGWQASALLPRLTIAITFVLVCLFVCLLLIFCLLFLNFLNCLFAFFFKIHRQGLDCADDPNWDLFFSCFLLLVVFLFVFLLFVCFLLKNTPTGGGFYRRPQLEPTSLTRMGSSSIFIRRLCIFSGYSHDI